MTTREEVAWEVESAARRAMRVAHGSRGISAKSRWINAATRIDSAASQLKRDGLLREMLAALAGGLIASGDPEESATKREIGLQIEALLKEFP